MKKITYEVEHELLKKIFWVLSKERKNLPGINRFNYLMRLSTRRQLMFELHN